MCFVFPRQFLPACLARGWVTGRASSHLRRMATLLSVFAAVCSAPIRAEIPADWHPIVEERFDGALDDWVVEQTPGGITRINNGRLEIDGGGCTVWLKRRLEGPIMIEYDATVVVAGGPNDNGRDLNCFWMATNPQEPDNLFTGRTSSSESRAGVFARYDALQTYYVGCGGNNNTTTRFRRYDGNGGRPLLPEHDLTQPEYLLAPNHTYRVRVIADGSRIQWIRDGRVFFDVYDPEPFTRGWFGFRTVDSHLQIDNVTVYARRSLASTGAAIARPGIRQVLFKSTPVRGLYLHVIEPAGHTRSDSAAAIVFFHGGGWRDGSSTQFDAQARHLAARGMVAIQADYRLIERDGATPFESVQDARSAMRWVRAHAATMGIDPTRIAAGGGSAGGHLAAACALLPNLDDPADDLQVSCRPDALVLFNPVFDNGPDGGYAHNLFGSRYSEISPAHNIRAGAPPTIVWVGDRDANVPVVVCERFRSGMTAVGARCELLVYPGQGHGFFNLHKGGPEIHAKTIREMDTFLVSLGYLRELEK